MFPSFVLDPATGALRVDSSGLTVSGVNLLGPVSNNGLKLNNAGQLQCKSGGVAAFYIQGLPFTSTGELCITPLKPAGAPTVIFDFSTGVLDPRITCARTGVATTFDSGGNLVDVAANLPRFWYDPVTLENQGLLVELSVTNQAANNTMVGAAAGSPGTVPTNWAVDDGVALGLTRTIVGTGVENGINYIDIKYAGTPTATGSLSIGYLGINTVASTPGQTWNVSGFFKLMAGSLANVSLFNSIAASDGVAVLGDNSLAFTPGSASSRLAANRISHLGTLASFAATTRAQGRVRVDVTIGLPVDFTLRIGLPQFAAGNTIVSPIKTSGAAVTLQSDKYSVTGTNFSSWFNPAEGTFIWNARLSSLGNGYFGTFSDNSSVNIFRMQAGATGAIGTINSSSVAQYSQTIATPGRATMNPLNVAYAYKQDDTNMAANGILGTVDTSCLMPVSPTQLTIGSEFNTAGQIYGLIKSMQYFPVRMSDAGLKAATEATFWVGGVLVSDSAVRAVMV